MISNRQNSPLPNNQRRLNTCLHNRLNRNSSILDSNICRQSPLENATPKMSSMTAAVAAASANNKPLLNPPMEAVVVNSIIYSKPSFCRISVDIDDVPIDKKRTTKLTIGSCPDNITCFSEKVCHSSMDLRNSFSCFDAISCFKNLPATTTLDVDKDTKLYRMCTTLNGSIHHQVSDLCDNILAMAGIYGVTSNEHDDDSFIEFAYRDDSDDEDDEGNEDDIKEDEFNDEDDDDIVDFSYDCPFGLPENLNHNKAKKVRFNTKPIVHNMHTWSYAYREARKGEWEMYARDRERFKIRIRRVSFALSPFLEREHRQKIYEKRFANLYNENDDQNEVSIETMEPKKNSKNNESKNNESKNAHQKRKRKKRRFCKMGNKHYF